MVTHDDMKNVELDECLTRAEDIGHNAFGIINTDVSTFKGTCVTGNQNNIPNNTLNIFRGWPATIARDSISYSIYFGSYHNLKDYNINTLIAGGSAGWMCWLFSYPIDTIKTRVQSSDVSYMTVIKQQKLWKGFTYCSVRAIISNAILFYTYELFYNNI